MFNQTIFFYSCDKGHNYYATFITTMLVNDRIYASRQPESMVIAFLSLSGNNPLYINTMSPYTASEAGAAHTWTTENKANEDAYEDECERTRFRF